MLLLLGCEVAWGQSSQSQQAHNLRFEINMEATERANLKMGSRLLALAKTVIGAYRGI